MVVEIDRSSHDKKVDYDRIRQEYLGSFGLLVFRITDFDVNNNLTVVMKELENFIIYHYRFNHLDY